MLLTITATTTATMPNAGDLGFVLHKHPDRAQSFPTSVGTAHVVWPEVTSASSTVALLLEVDPIALVRGKGHQGEGFALSQYVNDRPYAASSMLSVALGRVFRTAMAGRCDARPELAAVPLPVRVHLPALPSRGDPSLVERLFAPLGWVVEARTIPLDPTVPGWGSSPYLDVTIRGSLRVADVLTQLYVLLPVLDDAKHYWVGDDEVEKLLRAGRAWLPDHPQRDLITQRYLGHHRSLVLDAVGRLAELDDADPDADPDAEPDAETDAADDELPAPPTSLAAVRKAAVLQVLRAEGATSVVDVGCGEGLLLRDLVADPAFARVLGVDVSPRALQRAGRRLGLDRMPDSQRARLELLQSSVTYRDDRLDGYDAIVLMEVVEHLDPDRLPALERTVFGHARPSLVVVTTPNVEYNPRYEGLAPGGRRHRDHRFEWTRAELEAWAEAVAARYSYAVRFLPVGESDAEVGPPTQMAVFRRSA